MVSVVHGLHGCNDCYFFAHLRRPARPSTGGRSTKNSIFAALAPRCRYRPGRPPLMARRSTTRCLVGGHQQDTGAKADRIPSGTRIAASTSSCGDATACVDAATSGRGRPSGREQTRRECVAPVGRLSAARERPLLPPHDGHGRRERSRLPAPAIGDCYWTSFGYSATLSSTRRFCARPSSVSLLATGCVLPSPRTESRASGTPSLTRNCFTEVARCNESFRLY
jgi:hypothetical protein